VINQAVEHENPKEPGGAILELLLGPKDNETAEEFRGRMESFTHGVHQIFFEQLTGSRCRLMVQLSPSWEEPEEEDFSKLDKAELLRDLDAAPAGTHNNKLDYGVK
jgi:hypothetical protein